MQKDYYKREKRGYFFLPVLLRYNWHKALYKFKMHSKIICYIWLHTSWNDYHKFSAPSSHIRDKIKETQNVFLVMRILRIYYL